MIQVVDENQQLLDDWTRAKLDGATEQVLCPRCGNPLDVVVAVAPGHHVEIRRCLGGDEGALVVFCVGDERFCDGAWDVREAPDGDTTPGE